MPSRAEQRYDMEWKRLKDAGKLYGKYKRGLGPDEVRSMRLTRKNARKKSKRKM